MQEAEKAWQAGEISNDWQPEKASFAALSLLSVGSLRKSICFDRRPLTRVIGVSSMSFAKCSGNEVRREAQASLVSYLGLITWVMDSVRCLFLPCFPSIAHKWSFHCSLVSLPEGWESFQSLKSLSVASCLLPNRDCICFCLWGLQQSIS